jgi:hypothetical protein
VLGEQRIARRIGAERRTGAVQRKVVDPALRVVQRPVDASELFVGERIGGQARLDLRQPLVVRLLEGLEGAGKIVEGGGHVVGGGFGLEGLRHRVLVLQRKRPAGGRAFGVLVWAVGSLLIPPTPSS